MDNKANNLLDQIESKCSIGREELKKKIIAKQKELDNIVSFEGAAYLVAEELNIDIVDKKEFVVKIKEISKTMPDFITYGKVIQLFDVNEYKTEKGSGKVQNLIIGDETGSIGVSLWNEVIDNLPEIKIGDVVKITNPRIRENNFGNLEIRCFSKDNIIIDKEKTIDIDASKTNSNIMAQNEIEGDYYLISLKKKPIIYYLCPNCRKKLIDGVCQTHGKVEGNLFLVLSGIIDNGIERVDAVFFNTMVYDILKTKDLEKIEQIEHLPNFMDLSCIGGFYHIKGTVRENNFTKENEIIVRSLEQVNVSKKIKDMEQKFGEFQNTKK